MENARDRHELPRQPELPADYFRVVAHYEEWYVSLEMARAIESALNEAPTPEWIMFVDLTGARVRVRSRLIEYIHQCTADQRTLSRAFYRALRAERKADPDCEEED